MNHSMNKLTWMEAGGEFQIPFINAASRIANGEYPICCPKCKDELLRFYFHLLNADTKKGSLWIWCDSCKQTAHLPRVKPRIKHIKDRFAELKSEEFVQLEMDPDRSFLDRLNQLWNEGKINIVNP